MINEFVGGSDFHTVRVVRENIEIRRFTNNPGFIAQISPA